MITVLNRREVMATFSLKTQAEARELLSGSGIDYTVHVKNRISPSPVAAGARAHTGTLGQKMDCLYEYRIYVRRQDYERAAYLLRTVKREQI